MSLLVSQHAHCPYCGEAIELLVDTSIAEQDYIEDCEVCCRPINIRLEVTNSGEVSLSVNDENNCV